MTATKTGTPIPAEDENAGNDLDGAIRDYVRTHVLWHGWAKAVERFGVSRHTLRRCLERGRLGKSLPVAVINTIGDEPDAIAAAVVGHAATDARPLTAAVPGWYANLMVRSYP